MTRLEKLQEFLKSDPDDSFTRYAIGLEYRSMNDLHAAARQLEALVASDPGYVATYYQLADCYRGLHEQTKALDTYRKGIIQAKAVNDLHTLSELQMAMEEFEEEIAE